MSGFKFFWDTRKGLFAFKWNGLFSIGKEEGKTILRILGVSTHFSPNLNKVRVPVKWLYIKNGFSFLTQWRVERVEGRISLPDPMINGVLYGWLCAFEGVKPNQRFSVTVNFLGENNFSGQASIPPKILFAHLRRWIVPLFLERWRLRRKQSEGERKRR